MNQAYKENSTNIDIASDLCRIPEDLESIHCTIRKRDQVPNSVGETCEKEGIVLNVKKIQEAHYFDKHDHTKFCYPFITMDVEAENHNKQCLIQANSMIAQKCYCDDRVKTDPLSKESIMECSCFLILPPDDRFEDGKNGYFAAFRENCVLNNKSGEEKLSSVSHCRISKNSFLDNDRYFNPNMCNIGVGTNGKARRNVVNVCYIPNRILEMYCEMKERSGNPINSAKVCEDEKSSLAVDFSTDRPNFDPASGHESCYPNIEMHVRKINKGKCIIPEKSISVQDCFCDQKRQEWKRNSRIQCACAMSISKPDSSSKGSKKDTLYFRESCEVEPTGQTNLLYISKCKIIDNSTFLGKPDSNFAMLECSQLMKGNSGNSTFGTVMDTLGANIHILLLCTVFNILILIGFITKILKNNKKREERERRERERQRERQRERETKKERERKERSKKRE